MPSTCLISSSLVKLSSLCGQTGPMISSIWRLKSCAEGSGSRRRDLQLSWDKSGRCVSSVVSSSKVKLTSEPPTSPKSPKSAKSSSCTREGVLDSNGVWKSSKSSSWSWDTAGEEEDNGGSGGADNREGAGVGTPHIDESKLKSSSKDCIAGTCLLERRARNKENVYVVW